MTFRALLRTALPAVAAALLLLSGCGTQQVVQSQRADVTAAPPPDGGQIVAATPKPHKHKRHKKAVRTKPGEWPVMRDAKSGITFALPARSGAALDDYPAPGGGMTHSRSYSANTRDDLTLRVVVQDTSAFKPEYLSLMEQGTSQWLTSAGAGNVVDAGSARRLTVGGDPAYEYGLLFDQAGGLGRGMMRVTVIALPHHLVIAETFTALGAETVLRQGHVTSVHSRLMARLRLA